MLPILSFGSEEDKRRFEAKKVLAEQGDAMAQLFLGIRYSNGTGVPKDDKEAAKWYRLAADQGVAKAQYSLGSMYATGKGVPKDNLLAYMWTNIAGANGHDVEENMGIISGEMSQADIAKAQEMTRQYIKDHPDVYWSTEPDDRSFYAFIDVVGSDASGPELWFWGR